MPQKTLWISYNEENHGPFDEAVQISNTRGCVTWLHPSALNPDNWPCPMQVLISISGENKHFVGRLLAVQRESFFGPDFPEGERNHRPFAWREKDREGRAYKSVLFVHGLREIPKPPEIEGRHPPESATFLEME